MQEHQRLAQESLDCIIFLLLNPPTSSDLSTSKGLIQRY
ncbi:unnamed protein product [Musa acuminata subsp. burmannicoides]